MDRGSGRGAGTRGGAGHLGRGRKWMGARGGARRGRGPGAGRKAGLEVEQGAWGKAVPPRRPPLAPRAPLDWAWGSPYGSGPRPRMVAEGRRGGRGRVQKGP